jgi:hypothetical protein
MRQEPRDTAAAESTAAVIEQNRIPRAHARPPCPAVV